MDQASELKQWVQNANLQRTGVRIISVTSGKGGSGKTNLAVNVAIELAKLGQRVLILDADFGLANVDVLMGYPITYNLWHVINEEMTIADVVFEGHYGVKFISGGSGVQELLSLKGHHLNTLINAMLQLEKLADIIIIDTGAGVGETVLRMIRASSEMLVVTTPEPTAIMDAYALVKTVCFTKSGEMPIVRLVINKAETKREAEMTLDSFARIVQKYLDFSIDKLGYVPNDPNVSRAVKAQLPVVMGYAQSPATQAYTAIARVLANEPPEQEARRTGIRQFFDKIIRTP